MSVGGQDVVCSFKIYFKVVLSDSDDNLEESDNFVSHKQISNKYNENLDSTIIDEAEVNFIEIFKIF